MKPPIPWLLAVAILAAGCTETRRKMAGPADNDQNVLTGGPRSGTTLELLPLPVKETLQQRVPHAEVKDIDKTTRHGRVMYEISFWDKGRRPRLDVFENGEVAADSTEKK